TRREVELAASAPNGPEDEGPRYPGTCRGRYATRDAARAASGREPAWRFAARAGIVAFEDGFAGSQHSDVERDQGDFVIAKAAGRVVALLARWSGLPAGDSVRAGELVPDFEWARVPRERVVFDAPTTSF